MEPEALAYAEAARALDQQRAELDSVRRQAATLLGAAAIVTSLFAGLAVSPGKGLHGVQWVALGLFCIVAVSCLVAQVPRKAWWWIPPAQDLVRDYVDGESRLEGRAMQRDLALHLGENLVKNRKPLNGLYFLLMAGLAGLGLEVLFWLLSM